MHFYILSRFTEKITLQWGDAESGTCATLTYQDGRIQ